MTVLYFASARDLASKEAESVSLPPGATLGELRRALLKLHPSLARLSDSVRFSVNTHVSGDGAPLHEGDEVGVLPPVAGG